MDAIQKKWNTHYSRDDGVKFQQVILYNKKS